MHLQELLQSAVEQQASDVYIIAGRPLSMRLKGVVQITDNEVLMPADTTDLVNQIYVMSGRDMKKFQNTGDDDFSFAIPGLSRFRVNAFKQRGSMSAVIRIITFEMPDPVKLGIPPYLFDLCDANNGMVLLTGPTGCGKSTTLACMVDYINKKYCKHVITLEDPIEYLHKHNKSIISQREITIDSEDYPTALRASLRQSPDVIQLGEMRDFETIRVALTAAETGHLIFSTLHTVGAANTIDRIIDVFPPQQQRQIAVQLSMTLNAVISQKLIPDVNGNIIPAFEVMTITPAIRNMIREHKIPQIDGMLRSSNKPDMIGMDTALLNLYKARRITAETAILHSNDTEAMAAQVKLRLI